MNFRIVVSGDHHAAQVLEGIAANASYARPAMEEIYLTILDIEDEAFENEGARAGFAKWAALTLSTVVRKARRGGDPRILHETLRLRRAMTTYRSPDALVRIHTDKIVFMPRITKDGANIGMLHQRGYTMRSHGFKSSATSVPARPIIRFARRDADAFGREIMRYVMSKRGPGSIGVNFG